MKKNLFGPILTFISSVLIILLIFLTIGMFEHTIFVSDLQAQYYPALTHLQNILSGDASFIYNFNAALGDSFLGTFYYYLSSPLNILAIFIKDINVLVYVLVILKLSLASTFTYLFLRYQFKEEKIHFLIPLSLFYGISSFGVCYYFHIMWLDIYMLFPLILMGIDKIIKEHKHLLFIISFFLALLANYYFGFMLAIFSFLYYNYKLLLKYKIKKDIKIILKENIHFIIIGILTCLLASFILIPIGQEITNYSRENTEFMAGENLKVGFNIFYFIERFILGDFSNLDVLNTSGFYIHTSILTIPLLYFYFINKKINKKEKIITSFILLLFILSMSINYLNYFWHGFMAPSYFNGRYIFMFLLFIILICTKSLYEYKNIKSKHYFIIFVCTIILVSLLYFVRNIHATDIVKIVILILYLLSLWVIADKKQYYFLIILVALYELCFNGWSYISGYNEYFVKFNDIDSLENYGNGITYIKKHDKEKFYRIENNCNDLINRSYLFNYNGIDYFMSTIKKDIVSLFNNLSITNHSYTKNTIKFDGYNFILSSILNVKYFIDENNRQNIVYEEFLKTDDFSIYQNPYALNLGYMVDQNILNNIKVENNGLEYLRQLLNNMLGYDTNILKPVEVTKIDNFNYQFNNVNNDNYYVLITFKDGKNFNKLKMFINDKEAIRDNGNSYYYHIFNDYQDIVNLKLDIAGGDEQYIDNVYVYYYNIDKFKEIFNVLKEEQLNIQINKGHYLSGTIKVKHKNILFTSIPYDENWHVYIDGKEVTKEKLLNSLIGIKLSKGEHKIEFKYIPKNLYLSFIPSIISAIVLVAYLKKFNLNKKM